MSYDKFGRVDSSELQNQQKTSLVLPKCDFFYNQYKTHHVADLGSIDLLSLSNIEKALQQLTEDAKNLSPGNDVDNRKNAKAIKILEPMEPDMISKEQDHEIQKLQGRTVNEVLDYARNQQFYKAFKKHSNASAEATVSGATGSVKKITGLTAPSWAGIGNKVTERITKIQTGSDYKQRLTEFIYVNGTIYMLTKGIDKNGLSIKLRSLDSKTLLPNSDEKRFYINENVGESEFVLETSVEGKLWILFENCLYFYRIKNNWKSKKYQLFLQRYDIVVMKLEIIHFGEEVGPESIPIFGRDQEVSNIFGVKMVLFQEDFKGFQVQKSVKVPPQEHLKFTENQFFKNQFVLLVSEEQDSKQTIRHTASLRSIKSITKNMAHFKVLRQEPMSFNLCFWGKIDLEDKSQFKNAFGMNTHFFSITEHSQAVSQISCMGFVRNEKPCMTCFRARNIVFYEQIKNQISFRFDEIYHQVFTLVKNDSGVINLFQAKMGGINDKFKYKMIRSIGMLDQSRIDFYNDQLTFIYHEELRLNQVITQQHDSQYMKFCVSHPIRQEMEICDSWKAPDQGMMSQIFKQTQTSFKQVLSAYSNIVIDDEFRIKYIPLGTENVVISINLRGQDILNKINKDEIKYHYVEEVKRTVEQKTQETPDPQVGFDIEEKITNKYRIYQSTYDDRHIWLRLHFTDNNEKVYLNAYDSENKVIIRKNLEYIDTKIPKYQTHLVQLVPSSAVQMIDEAQCKFTQLYQLMIMADSHLYCKIYEYCLTWSEIDPQIDSTSLNLIGRKLLILTKPYMSLPQVVNFFPNYNKQNNFLINGTHLFTNNKNSDLSIIMLQPKQTDFQFKGEICNSGYQLFQTKDKVKTALLIDTRLSDELMQYDADQLSICQRNIIFEQQIRVIMNMWPQKPIQETIIQNLTEFETDFFAPLESLNCNCIADFMITNPNTVDYQMNHTHQITQKSLIEEFAQSMKFKQENGGQCIDYYPVFIASLPRECGWIRQRQEIFDDLNMSNPIMRCLKHPELQKTIISCNMFIKSLFQMQDNQVNYNKLIQILPEILLQEKYEFREYATFFSDLRFDNEIQHSTFANYLHDKDLPKFSDREADLDEFQAQESPQSDKRDLIVEKLIIKNENERDTVLKNIPVRHFVIDFEYLITSQKMGKFLNERNIDPCSITEHQFSEIVFKINEKYGEDIVNQENLQHIIDFQFHDATEKFYNQQLIFYVLGFIIPFMIQLLVVSLPPFFVIFFNVVCLITTFAFIFLEVIQLKQIGLMEYFKVQSNVLEVINGSLYIIYFLCRIFDQEPMLVYKDSEFKVTPQLAALIVMNVLLVMFCLSKLMYYMQVNEKFGLLVQLIIQCVRDIREFFIFLMLWISTFSILYVILGSNNSLSDKYPNMGQYSKHFIQTWENAIGNIEVPTYNYWNKHLSSSDDLMTQSISSLMIHIVYLIWLLNQLMVLIILLNFLIAVISQSYENVMNSSTVFKYNQRSKLNQECRQVYQLMGMLRKSIHCLILQSSTKFEKPTWRGLVSAIQRHAEKQNAEMKYDILREVEKNKSQLQQHINQVSAETLSEINQIKTMLKDMALNLSSQTKNDVDAPEVEIFEDGAESNTNLEEPDYFSQNIGQYNRGQLVSVVDDPNIMKSNGNKMGDTDIDDLINQLKAFQ